MTKMDIRNNLEEVCQMQAQGYTNIMSPEEYIKRKLDPVCKLLKANGYKLDKVTVVHDEVVLGFSKIKGK